MALYKHGFGGKTTLNTNWQFGWHSESSLPLATVQAAAVVWLNTFWAAFDDFAPTTVTADKTSTREINPATGQQLALAETATPKVGLLATAALPPDDCIVVSLRTPLANRRGRGRFFLPPVAASLGVTTAGRLVAATQSALVTGLSSAWSGYSPSGNPVVYSRLGAFFTAITTFDIPDLFESQKGRTAGVVLTRVSAAMP